MSYAQVKIKHILAEHKYRGKELTVTMLKDLKSGTLLVKKHIKKIYAFVDYKGGESFRLATLSPLAWPFWEEVMFVHQYRVASNKDMLEYMIKEVL